jgi:hypothetical protein
MLAQQASLQVPGKTPCFSAGENCNAPVRRLKRRVNHASYDFSQLMRNETGTSPKLFLASLAFSHS